MNLFEEQNERLAEYKRDYYLTYEKTTQRLCGFGTLEDAGTFKVIHLISFSGISGFLELSIFFLL